MMGETTAISNTVESRPATCGHSVGLSEHSQLDSKRAVLEQRLEGIAQAIRRDLDQTTGLPGPLCEQVKYAAQQPILQAWLLSEIGGKIYCEEEAQCIRKLTILGELGKKYPCILPEVISVLASAYQDDREEVLSTAQEIFTSLVSETTSASMLKLLLTAHKKRNFPKNATIGFLGMLAGKVPRHILAILPIFSKSYENREIRWIVVHALGTAITEESPDVSVEAILPLLKKACSVRNDIRTILKGIEGMEKLVTTHPKLCDQAIKSLKKFCTHKPDEVRAVLADTLGKLAIVSPKHILRVYNCLKIIYNLPPNGFCRRSHSRALNAFVILARLNTSYSSKILTFLEKEVQSKQDIAMKIETQETIEVLQKHLASHTKK